MWLKKGLFLKSQKKMGEFCLSIEKNVISSLQENLFLTERKETFLTKFDLRAESQNFSFFSPSPPFIWCNVCLRNPWYCTRCHRVSYRDLAYFSATYLTIYVTAQKTYNNSAQKLRNPQDSLFGCQAANVQNLQGKTGEVIEIQILPEKM